MMPGVEPAQLMDALWSRSDLHRAKYAIGSEVDAAAYCMPTSIHVDGAGDLALPLSHDGLLKLKSAAQASYGQGEQNRLWQVDASKVSCPQIPDFFSKAVFDLAGAAMMELGIDVDALGLEVRLEKLLAHEQGGHFEFQRRNKKEVAMMILQLPTQSGHEGGQLEIHDRKKRRTSFDFSGVQSTKSYFKTVFFSDCERKLAEVKKGTQLCLVFSLARNNLVSFETDIDATSYISALGGVQMLFREWALQYGTTLAIPLGHKYSKDLSFAGLKGYDRVVATLLLSCTDFLDVHLCMLEKEIVTYMKYEDLESRDEWKLGNWSTVDGSVRHFTSFSFDEKHVLIQHGDLFWGPSRGAALVVWPRQRRMEALWRLQPMQNVVDFLEEQHEQDPEKTSAEVRSFVADKPEIYSNWIDNGNQISIDDADLLLEFCLNHDLQDAAFMILKRYTSSLFSSRIGTIGAIQKYGWDVCYREVIQKAIERVQKDFEVARFPMRLRENGFEDAAVYVAKKLLNKYALTEVPHYIAKDLIQFFAVSGLEEETWRLWSNLSIIDTDCLAAVAKAWGEKSIPHIEEFLERWLKKEVKTYMPVSKTPVDQNHQNRLKNMLEELERNGRRRILQEVGKVSLKLWEQGCGDVALGMVKRNWIKGVPLEELYGGEDGIMEMDAIVLLLHFDERFHDSIRMLSSGREIEALLRRMRKEADLFGLKKDAKVTQLFADLLSKRLYSFENAAVPVDLLDTAFWLGDEKIVADIVKLAGSDPYIMDSMFQTVKWTAYFASPRRGYYVDEDEEDAEVPLDEFAEDKERMEKAKQDIGTMFKQWDVVGKDGFRKVVNARIRYFSLGGDEEMRDVEEDQVDSETQRSKRRRLDPMIDRVREDELEERSVVEVEWLREVLAVIA